MARPKAPARFPAPSVEPRNGRTGFLVTLVTLALACDNHVPIPCRWGAISCHACLAPDMAEPVFPQCDVHTEYNTEIPLSRRFAVLCAMHDFAALSLAERPLGESKTNEGAPAMPCRCLATGPGRSPRWIGRGDQSERESAPRTRPRRSPARPCFACMHYGQQLGSAAIGQSPSRLAE